MDTFLTISEVAVKLRKSVKTLQRWDRTGIFKAQRTPTGRRMYPLQSVMEFVGMAVPQAEKTVIVYCRVSSQAQKPDLKNQRRVLSEFCASRGMSNAEFVEEIGGGLNFKRKLFLSVVDRVIAGEVSDLIVAHRDRLARFGFDLLAHLCGKHGCKLHVVDSQQLSPEQEMVTDLMTIVHCFSSRLYGLRNYRKSLKKALAEK